jgi:hypothetical protein
MSFGSNLISGTIDIGGSVQSGIITIGKSSAGQTINIGTVAGPQIVNIGSTNTTSSTNINSGSGNITLSGLVLTPTNPSFRVRQNGNVTGATGGINNIWWIGRTGLSNPVIDFDTGSNIDPLNAVPYVFVAPVPGIYHITFSATITNLTSSPISINTSIEVLGQSPTLNNVTLVQPLAPTDNFTLQTSGLLKVTSAGQRIRGAIVAEGQPSIDIFAANIYATTYFCGYLVG